MARSRDAQDIIRRSHAEPSIESTVQIVDCGSNILALQGFQCGADTVMSSRAEKESSGTSLIASGVELFNTLLFGSEELETSRDPYATQSTACDTGRSTGRTPPRQPRRADPKTPMTVSPLTRQHESRETPHTRVVETPGTSRSVVVDESPGPGTGLTPSAPYCWKVPMCTGARQGPAEIETELRRLRRHYPALVQHQVQPEDGTDRHGAGRYAYIVNGRPVILTVVGGDKRSKDAVATLMVKDGFLNQPLVDYVFNTGKNEEFESMPGPANNGAIHLVPEDKRMKVPDVSLHPEDRLAAMHCAKHHAEMRDEHARRAADKKPSYSSGFGSRASLR